MEEQKNNYKGKCDCGCGNLCGCGGWSSCWGGHGRHFLLRWVLGFVILFSIFALGVKVGELKSLLRSEFGYGDYGMRGGYHRNMMYYGNFPSGTNYPTMMKFQVPVPTPTK